MESLTIEAKSHYLSRFYGVRWDCEERSLARPAPRKTAYSLVILVILNFAFRVFLIFRGRLGCRRIIADFNRSAINARHRLLVEVPSGSLCFYRQVSFRPFDHYALHLEYSPPDSMCLSIA